MWVGSNFSIQTDEGASMGAHELLEMAMKSPIDFKIKEEECISWYNLRRDGHLVKAFDRSFVYIYL